MPINERVVIMLECYFCHRPNNQGSATGHRMHEECRKGCADVIAGHVLALTGVPLSEYLAFKIVDDLCLEMHKASQGRPDCTGTRSINP